MTSEMLSRIARRQPDWESRAGVLDDAVGEAPVAGGGLLDHRVAGLPQGGVDGENLHGGGMNEIK